MKTYTLKHNIPNTEAKVLHASQKYGKKCSAQHHIWFFGQNREQTKNMSAGELHMPSGHAPVP